jgi:hypothetical protein
MRSQFIRLMATTRSVVVLTVGLLRSATRAAMRLALWLLPQRRGFVFRAAPHRPMAGGPARDQ